MHIMTPELGSAASTQPTPHLGRHQQIRDVALDLFVSEGFSRVSLRQLGKELGLQVGSLYNHLESKEDLLFELISEHLESLSLETRRRVARERGVLARLIAFVEVHIEFHVRYPLPSRLASLELRSLRQANQESIRELLKCYHSMLRQIIAEGIAQSCFKAVPLPVALRAILSMLNGIAFWFTEHGDLDELQLKRHYTDMILGALGSQKS